MTSVLLWLAADSRGASSLYIATDSRLSNETSKWDSGPKALAATTSPEIFAYCGDALLGSNLLSTVVQQINLGTLFETTATPEKKIAVLCSAFAAPEYPGFHERPLEILYATRKNV